MLCRVRGINYPILQWYKDLEPWWDTAALQAHLKHTKCKGQYRSTTPPGVWDISFPDSD